MKFGRVQFIYCNITQNTSNVMIKIVYELDLAFSISVESAKHLS